MTSTIAQKLRVVASVAALFIAFAAPAFASPFEVVAEQETEASDDHSSDSVDLDADEDDTDSKDKSNRGRSKDKADDRGKGHAFGRGHSDAVHVIISEGGSPSDIAGEHGKTISEAVHVYNELRKGRRLIAL